MIYFNLFDRITISSHCSGDDNDSRFVIRDRYSFLTHNKTPITVQRDREVVNMTNEEQRVITQQLHVLQKTNADQSEIQIWLDKLNQLELERLRRLKEMLPHVRCPAVTFSFSHKHVELPGPWLDFFKTFTPTYVRTFVPHALLPQIAHPLGTYHRCMQKHCNGHFVPRQLCLDVLQPSITQHIAIAIVSRYQTPDILCHECVNFIKTTTNTHILDITAAVEYLDNTMKLHTYKTKQLATNRSKYYGGKLTRLCLLSLQWKCIFDMDRLPHDLHNLWLDMPLCNPWDTRYIDVIDYSS